MMPEFDVPGTLQTVFSHTLFSVGIADQDEQTIVVVHAMMGTQKFEFRFTPENARVVASAFSDAAANADAENAAR